MTRILPGVIAMATVVVASNILVQFFVGDWLTWGAFTYPIAFLVTDVMNRVYGASAARRVVFVGFAVGVICSLIGSQVEINLGTADDPFMAPAVTLRVAIGSGIAFLTAQLLDIAIFSRLRAGTWWRAPLVSSVIGSAVDTALFFSIAFSAGAVAVLGADHNTDFFNEVVATPFGFDATRWVGTAVVDWGVKIAIALIALIPFRLIVGRIQQNAQMS
ncbi:queuosine precursor transporter [Pseudooctadecabacter jejudonensis]|uniref:Probable queuosine precursor transporter n=1 Tax=Pseudooctadecabacter jejudonensis TaxID=1391910 RepID=A0A1Y5S6Q3_9RHOB|nr:queuosine precursor transporter [Pseudooctadecabacter jejudonensis]SLN31391.1 Inner membrane protein YhhQ [Pseudooctadecabacter jejudonensis]